MKHIFRFVIIALLAGLPMQESAAANKISKSHRQQQATSNLVRTAKKNKQVFSTMSLPDDTYWSGKFFMAGVQYALNTIAINGSDVYVGGSLDAVNDLPLSNVAHWNGTSWSDMAGGLNGEVRSMVIGGSDVYVAGLFTDAGGDANADYIARWNGTSWNAVGSGLNGDAEKVIYAAGILYVMGSFTDAGGDPDADYLAVWNGTSWSNVGGVIDGSLYDFSIDGSNVYIAGNFVSVGGDNTINKFAMWNGTSWTNLDAAIEAVSGDVYGIAAGNGIVYVTGSFTDLDGDPDIDDLAIWNGTTWGPVTITGVDFVESFFFDGSDFYATTTTYNVMGEGIVTIKKESGGSWVDMNGGLNGSIDMLVSSGSDVFVAGSFSKIDGSEIVGIAKFNGSSWSSIGQEPGFGIEGNINCMTVVNGEMFVGGTFTEAGGDTSIDGIARWDGSAYHKVGSGLYGSMVNWPGIGDVYIAPEVIAVATNGTDLYVGGTFTSAYSVANTSYIARWDGSSWQSVGGGLNGMVQAIAVDGDRVYAGGTFTDAGGNADADGIAYWDGTNWNSMGSGSVGNVYSIKVKGDDVYVGGNFSQIRGLVTYGIARWDGTTWHALGDGLYNYVNDLEFIGDTLYAGGGIGSSGLTSLSNLVKWNGTSWENVGGAGVNNNVECLIPVGEDLYVGGRFTDAGGDTGNDYFVKWNRSSFSLLGSSPEGFVMTSASFGDSIYIGGSFSQAGGKLSMHVAHWFKPVAAATAARSIAAPTGTAESFTIASKETAVDIAVSSSSGSATVTVSRYNDAPQNVSGISGNVSNYRWIVNEVGLDEPFTAEVRFNVSQIPSGGISDPNSVTVYSRSTPGAGSFTALTTSYDDGAGEIVATGVTGFSEFVFGSADPLPVELAELNIEYRTPNVEVRWMTATEVNNYGFEIQRAEVRDQKSEVSGHSERSEESSTWTNVGFVEGSGTTNSPKEYSFTEKNLRAGTYAYRLKQFDHDGKFKYSQEVEVTIGEVPKVFALDQNYPNPFNPATTIGFTLQQSGMTTLKIYDAIGREVVTLVNENLDAGVHHQRTFSASGGDASSLASGIYFARLQSGDKMMLKKMLLLK